MYIFICNHDLAPPAGNKNPVSDCNNRLKHIHLKHGEEAFKTVMMMIVKIAYF